MGPCVVDVKMKTLFRQCRLANDLPFCEKCQWKTKDSRQHLGSQTLSLPIIRREVKKGQRFGFPIMGLLIICPVLFSGVNIFVSFDEKQIITSLEDRKNVVILSRFLWSCMFV